MDHEQAEGLDGHYRDSLADWRKKYPDMDVTEAEYSVMDELGVDSYLTEHSAREMLTAYRRGVRDADASRQNQA